MGLPHVENFAAIPTLLERLRTRAPDQLYPETLTACGFDKDEYARVNGLLYFLNFYLPSSVDGPQVISSFWKDRYYRRDDHRAALGWMLKLKYGFIYDRLTNPLKPTKKEVEAAIKATRYIDEHQRSDSGKIANTFLMLHKQADWTANNHFGELPEWYVISGVMPRDSSPPTLAKLLGAINPVWWIVVVLAVALIVTRCNLDAARSPL